VAVYVDIPGDALVTEAKRLYAPVESVDRLSPWTCSCRKSELGRDW